MNKLILLLLLLTLTGCVGYIEPYPYHSYHGTVIVERHNSFHGGHHLVRGR